MRILQIQQRSTSSTYFGLDQSIVNIKHRWNQVLSGAEKDNKYFSGSLGMNLVYEYLHEFWSEHSGTPRQVTSLKAQSSIITSENSSFPL